MHFIQQVLFEKHDRVCDTSENYCSVVKGFSSFNMRFNELNYLKKKTKIIVLYNLIVVMIKHVY